VHAGPKRRIGTVAGLAAGKASLLLVLGVCCLTSGCGRSVIAKEPSVAAKREVARQFAEAIFRGKADAAVALLVHPVDPALSGMTVDAAAPWKTRHASVRLPGTRAGGGWVFHYVGTHPHSDGRFEQVRGNIVIVVAASAKGAGVEFFTLRNQQVRFRTHHDSQLLPSDR
jgi:hypothetical protein